MLSLSRTTGELFLDAVRAMSAGSEAAPGQSRVRVSPVTFTVATCPLAAASPEERSRSRAARRGSPRRRPAGHETAIETARPETRHATSGFRSTGRQAESRAIILASSGLDYRLMSPRASIGELVDRVRFPVRRSLPTSARRPVAARLRAKSR